MDKREAKFRLIRDIIIAVVAWGVGSLLFATLGELGFLGILAGLFVAGVPFGWMWLSKIFSAWSLPSIVAKFLGSIILGWIAIFVVLILDIVHVITAED